MLVILEFQQSAVVGTMPVYGQKLKTIFISIVGRHNIIDIDNRDNQTA